jgi:hypothetical protein
MPSVVPIRSSPCSPWTSADAVAASSSAARSAAGDREELAAGARQHDVVARALEQNDAELAFEASDELADRWLHDAEAFRSTAEVQLIRYGDERGELAQLHRATIARRDRSQCAMAIAVMAHAL